MAYQYVETPWAQYDDTKTLEENRVLNAVITQASLAKMEAELKRLSADFIVSVTTGETAAGDVVDDTNNGTKTFNITVPTSVGPKGDKGDPFAIAKSYSTIAAMDADFSNVEVPEGSFVIIFNTADDVDNAKLYVKGVSAYTFITDLSGPAGIKGDTGEAGAAATITIGSVTSGETAAVTNSGAPTAAVLDIVLPRATSTAVTVSLPVANWVSDEQTVTVTGLAADGTAIISLPVGVSDAIAEAVSVANIIASAQGANSITFKYIGTVPTIDLSLLVIILP